MSRGSVTKKAMEKAISTPATPMAISDADLRRRSRSTPLTVAAVRRPNIPPMTYPVAAPRKTPRMTLEVLASPTLVAISNPAVPSRAMKMRRTTSTMRLWPVPRLFSLIDPPLGGCSD